MLQASVYEILQKNDYQSLETNTTRHFADRSDFACREEGNRDDQKWLLISSFVQCYTILQAASV